MPKRHKRILRRKKPRLRYSRILAWADAHHARTGQWPSVWPGEIKEAYQDETWETWAGVNIALRQGLRGLRPGPTLVQLLYERRGLRNKNRPLPLTGDMILRWADRFHDQHGKWPREDSGPLSGAKGETWLRISGALLLGLRGLPGHSSLARLLAERRGVRNVRRPPPRTVTKILAWADAHRRRNGRWPNTSSGVIVEAPYDETWRDVNDALSKGQRGLRPGRTLARLLHRYRGARLIACAALPRPHRHAVGGGVWRYRRPGAVPISSRGEAASGVMCTSSRLGLHADAARAANTRQTA